MTLTVAQYEEIVDLLQEVPSLVDELESRVGSFSADVLAWLKKLERALTSNRLPEAAKVATGRAELLEASRGVRRHNLHIDGQASPRKIRDATASVVLGRASDTVLELVRDRQKVFEESARIAQQLVAVALAKHLHDPFLADDMGGDSLRHLSDRIASDADLGSLYAHLIGMVGRADCLVILDRARASLR